MPVRSRFSSLFIGAAMLTLATEDRASAQPCPKACVSFPWDLSVASVRAQGMGSADVSVTTDAASIGSNPAGLAFVPLHSVSVSAFLVGGDHLREPSTLRRSAWSWPPSLDVAIHPFKVISIGVRLNAPPHSLFNARKALGDVGLIDSLHETETHGLSLGARVHRKVGLGAGVSDVMLKSHAKGPGDQSLHATGWSLGVIVRPFDRRREGDEGMPFSGLQFGLAVRRAGEWGEGLASSATNLPIVGARAPAITSAGMSWHRDLGWGQKVLLSIQADRALSMDRASAGYQFSAGAEFSTFRRARTEGNGGLQVRAGVRRISTLAELYVLPGGNAVTPSMAGRPGRYVLSFGVSAVPSLKTSFLGGRTRLEAAVSRSADAWRTTVGLNYQFPRSQRRTLLGG